MKRIALKATVFVLLFAILLAAASKLVTSPADYRNYQWIAGFYGERKNSLDAVYIGGSNTYAFWAAPLAWKHYGIAVYPFACNSQPLVAAKYLMKEARKTQPDALYIVSLNGIGSDFPETMIHYLTDYLPMSLNKLQLIETLSDLGGFSAAERLEFYFPLIRYHTRWSKLTADDFHYTLDGLKGGSVYSAYLNTVSDVSGNFRSTTRRQALDDSLQDSLEDLLAYCDAEQVNVLFVTAPQSRTDESFLAQLNTINDLVESHGYPTINMMNYIDDIGLDLTSDYYNGNHTNLHGAIKITDYLAQYLIEHYDFQDKRGNPEYSDWDESYEKYVEKIMPYSLDFEYEGENRNYALAAPELSKISVNGTTLTLTWKAVAGADGYCVYRKITDSGWMPLETVDANTLAYEDKNCKPSEKYTYTVVAYQDKDGIAYWGNYDFSGISGTALLDAPNLLDLSGTENDLILTWESVKGADGYMVYRRVPSKSWINIADVGSETIYTDTAMLEDIPYQYRVRAYWYNVEETIMYSSYSSALLWLPELSGPEVTVELIDGAPTLSWPTIEGITGYTVSRKTADGDWEQVAEPLPADCGEFRDITAQSGTRYAYQVTAYLSDGNDTYSFSTQTPEIETQSTAVQLPAPEILFGEQVGNNIRIVWQPEDNATAYRIYRQTEGADTWTVVSKSTTSNTYQEKPSKAGAYTYLVQALRTEGECKYYGEFQANAGLTIVYTK